MAETETKEPAQSAEKKEAASGTPATPAAAATPKQDPQSKPAADKAAEGSTQRTTEEGDKSTDKATKIRFFQERQQKRTEKEREALLRENESLKRQLQERESQRTQEPMTAPSLLDDPDGWEKHKSKEIEDRIVSRLTEREREDRLSKESAAAEQYLMTQPHLKDPAFAADVQHLLANDPRLIAIAGSFPQEAAELVYQRVCQSRGLDAPAGSARADAAQRAKGAAPTAPGSSGGERTWSKGEATKYLDAVPMGSAEWKARLAEVQQAQREGRAS